MITIKEAITRKEMREYIMFSFELYKDNSYLVPPIIEEELTTFDRYENPVFQTEKLIFI